MIGFITKKVLLLLLLVLTPCQCSPNTGDAPLYLVHSSGLYVGCQSDGTAVLVAENQSKLPPAHLRLETQPDSSVCLVLDGAPTAYLSLGDKNNWTTFFLTDTVALKSRYRIEPVEDGSILLRNLHTGKYLGTDGISPDAVLYSDKSGTDVRHRWMLTADAHYRPVADTLNYFISTQVPLQPIEGWGVSLCWWARMCGDWSEERLDTLVDWMVSPKGLNWNIFRYNIGGGDDPHNANCEKHHMGKGKGLRAEMEGFQDQRGGPYNWERDAGQRRIMLKIKERRPDAIFEAFSNSAPWWMTVSGCCAGHQDPNQDNLKPEFYHDFAKYLVDVCVHYKEQYGIEFKTLEPFNEPVTDYWFANGSQEGCHFSTAEQVKFLQVLHPMLQASGLKTVIASSDETDTRQSVKDFLYYRERSALSMVGQWNTHTYGATQASRCQLGSLVRNAGKTLWMDEVGSGGQGILGNMNLCQKLFDDMHYMLPEAWLDWQYVEEHSDQWCQVLASFSDESSMLRVPNYYIRQQVTRFIKPGYRQVSSLSDKALAAISPKSDTLVIVLLNNSYRPAVHHIRLPHAGMQHIAQMYYTGEGVHMEAIDPESVVFSSDSLYLEVPRLSITTLIIPIRSDIQYIKFKRGLYCIVPQGNCGLALSTQPDSTVCLQPVNPLDMQQLWMLHPKNDGFVICNPQNKFLVAEEGQELMVSNKIEAHPLFKIHPAEPYFYMIAAEDGSVLSVEDNEVRAGATVCMESYGNSVMTYGRHWNLVPVMIADVDSLNENLLHKDLFHNDVLR